MTARLTSTLAWRRLFLPTAPLLERDRRRTRPRPDVEVAARAAGVADEEVRARRLLAAVPPLCFWRP